MDHGGRAGRCSLSAAPRAVSPTVVSRTSRTATHSALSPRIRSAGLARGPGRTADPARPGRLDPGPPCVLSTPAPTFRVWRCRTCMPRTDSVVVACLSDLPPDPNRSRMATRGGRPTACRADRQRTGRACRSARGNAESRNGGGFATSPPTVLKMCAVGYRCPARCLRLRAVSGRRRGPLVILGG